MTTADKAKEKLLDSMRKSKLGAGGKPSEGTRARATKKTTARRAPAKPATQTKRVPEAAVMKAATQLISNDPYQSHGRIWPD
ncbi:MAG: hypothetical protein WBQ78_08445 [Gammaproteobacteria bacterium]